MVVHLHLLQTVLTKCTQAHTFQECLDKKKFHQFKNISNSPSSVSVWSQSLSLRGEGEQANLEEYLDDAGRDGELGELHCAKHFYPLIEQLLNVAQQTAVHARKRRRRRRRYTQCPQNTCQNGMRTVPCDKL